MRACATACGSHKTMSVSFSDSWRLRAALMIKEADLVGYGCPFSEDYAVRIGGLTYCVAQDDCNSVYIKELNFYYVVSNEQHDTLDEILRDYGITKE